MSGGVAEHASSPDDPEDLKLITLARAALGRTGAAQGAAVRDNEGRAYAAASVQLEHLKLSAVVVAVAMAVCSGAGGLEAVVLAAAQEPSDSDLDVVRDLAVEGAVVWWTDTQGTVRSVIEL